MVTACRTDPPAFDQTVSWQKQIWPLRQVTDIFTVMITVLIRTAAFTLWEPLGCHAVYTDQTRVSLAFLECETARHNMMTSSNGNIFRVTGLSAGNSPFPGEFPAQRPVTRSIDVFFFICAWIKAWVNNDEAGDLRRHHAHYDVIVMNWSKQMCMHCPAMSLLWSMTPRSAVCIIYACQPNDTYMRHWCM